jgi:Uma2 family endonuclease
MCTVALAYLEHYSADEYRRWKGDWELIAGAPYAMTPPPTVSHQMVSVKIIRQLDEQLENCEICFALAETDWEVSSDTVVRPDCMVVCHKTGEKVIKTPTIIFEIISTSTAQRDEQLKFQLYEREGVEYYILVYPSRNVAKIYKLVNGRFQKAGDFDEESYQFEAGDCRIQFDFGKIWRRG